MTGFGIITAVGERDTQGRRSVTIRFDDGRVLETDNGHFFRNGSHPEVGIACFVVDTGNQFSPGITTAHSSRWSAIKKP